MTVPLPLFKNHLAPICFHDGLVCLACYNKVPRTGWLIDNRNLFLTARDRCLLCPHMVGGASKLSGLSAKRTNPTQTPTHMPPPDQVPQTHPGAQILGKCTVLKSQREGLGNGKGSQPTGLTATTCAQAQDCSNANAML